EKAKSESIVIWLEATGNASNDLQRIADRIWLDIRVGERPTPLPQVAHRLSEFLPALSEKRVYAFIDNIPDYEEAVAIINEAFPSKGISIAISCSDTIAKSLEMTFHREIAVTFCADFSWEQVHDLLHKRLGPEWTLIDDAVRETLRRPLLAAIYCDEVFESNWRPTNEYELYDVYWGRLLTRQQTSTPMDEVAIEALAERILNDEPYPWTLYQLKDAGIDNATLMRLERCGWLRMAAESWTQYRQHFSRPFAQLGRLAGLGKSPSP
ncbi:MAG: hypothetical protein JWM11_5169, partial [Planctomycetaceae bacterium]|nr:hypothetical protein [Planctomycetaceae bacterium]